MKNFHFGHGITIVLLVFIGFLITALIKSKQMNHSLVSEDYYAGDLAYQQTYDKLSNAIKDKKDFDLHWNSELKSHFLEFSDDNEKSGTIRFYRPSDSSLDFELDFNTEKKVDIKNIFQAASDMEFGIYT